MLVYLYHQIQASREVNLGQDMEEQMRKHARYYWSMIIPLVLLCGTAQAQMTVESIDPSSAEAGSDVDITVTTGVDCNVNVYSVELSFDPATTITHDEISAQDYNLFTTKIHIPQDAALGPQTVTVTTNGMDCVGNGVFEVTCSNCSSASIVSISPDSGNQGSTLDVNITGEQTHFDAGSTVEFDGGGIQVNTITPNSETSLYANITISPDAAPGQRSVTVTTDAEVAKGTDLFQVEQQAIELTPSSGTQGQNIQTVTISGGNGGYSNTSEVDMGKGIQIQSFSSPADDTLVLNNVQILEDAPVGPHTLVITVSGQRYSYSDSFSVLQGPNTLLLSVTPDHGDRGHPGLEISLVGQNTHFDDPDVMVDVSGDSAMATAGNAADSTHMTATLVIGDSATEDQRDISVEVGCSGGICIIPHEKVTLADGFTITEPGTIDSAQPSHIEAAQTVDVTFSATDGQFAQGETRLVFDPPDGIETQSVTVTDADHLTASITISDTAHGDPRNVKAVTGTEVAFGEQIIDIDNPSIDSVIPGSVYQGLTGISVTISGTDIPFASDTSIEIAGQGVTVSGVSFDAEKPDQIIATVDVSPTAPVGHRDLTVSTTAGITTTAKGAFNVLSRVSAENDKTGCNCSSTDGDVDSSLFVFFLGLLGLWINSCRRR